MNRPLSRSPLPYLSALFFVGALPASATTETTVQLNTNTVVRCCNPIGALTTGGGPPSILTSTPSAVFRTSSTGEPLSRAALYVNEARDSSTNELLFRVNGSALGSARPGLVGVSAVVTTTDFTGTATSFPFVGAAALASFRDRVVVAGTSGQTFRLDITPIIFGTGAGAFTMTGGLDIDGTNIFSQITDLGRVSRECLGVDCSTDAGVIVSGQNFPRISLTKPFNVPFDVFAGISVVASAGGLSNAGSRADFADTFMVAPVPSF